jgi:mRNA interferase MazF
MNRGSVVTVAVQGDYGKPRPAVVIQTDALNPTHGTILLCPITSQRVDAPDIWLEIEPTPGNGLRQPSRIMADRIVTVRRAQVGKTIGTVEPNTMLRLTQTLAMLLGIAG